MIFITAEAFLLSRHLRGGAPPIDGNEDQLSKPENSLVNETLMSRDEVIQTVNLGRVVRM